MPFRSIKTYGYKVLTFVALHITSNLRYYSVEDDDYARQPERDVSLTDPHRPPKHHQLVKRSATNPSAEPSNPHAPAQARRRSVSR